MTTKHTPWPWSLNIEDGRAEVCVDGERLTDPYIGDENARLISAAPELLEACKAALETIGLHEYPATGRLIAAAIAKAGGQA